ncbi:hypothetical protein DFR29_102540 [Tahibacter aquaticus]|uniref:DUF3558 domain-containing protein n=1 Tax=Tahibacter aquaticus TaxID=520092 RepID=A0A4R6Z7S0_9GAMM|nr:hypothetical protein [Tahibacter aquaticus]TDR47878.1 hypothetical protein DFR29_102540 [Tahibacter aquaticus]
MMLVLFASLALAAAPAAKPFERSGDYYQARFELPRGWKACSDKAPAPNRGFRLMPARGDCTGSAAAPVVLYTEFDMSDSEADTVAADRLREDGCSGSVTASDFAGRRWNLCANADGTRIALHILRCDGDTPLLVRVQQNDAADASAGLLFQRVLQHTQLRCPKAS